MVTLEFYDPTQHINSALSHSNFAPATIIFPRAHFLPRLSIVLSRRFSYESESCLCINLKSESRLCIYVSCLQFRFDFRSFCSLANIVKCELFFFGELLFKHSVAIISLKSTQYVARFVIF